MKYRGMTAQQAQETLLQCRPHVNSQLTERPVVVEYAKRLEQRRRGHE